MEIKLPILTKFNVNGSDTVEIIKVTEGNSEDVIKIWINDKQYFDDVPRIAWEFYIGGYQPAQKWLKDRKGMKLEAKDYLHYAHIISALYRTRELMNEIDK